MPKEKELVAALLHPKTQNEAFQRLVRDYQLPLYSLIRGIVLDHDDADDVIQATFIKVFQNLKDFKHDCRLFSWVYRIAKNEAYTFMEQKSRRYRSTTESMRDKILDALESDSYFEGDALQIKLQKAIATLPDKQQLVFRMRYFEELKYETMSEILGTSVGSLKASYHLAAKKIEEFIKTD